jgi:thioredoxin reductase
MVYDLCIIGGGQSGLVTLKTFSEKTDNIILLEKCNGCVGLFANIKENTKFKWSTSRYMSGFSDFPMSKDVPVWFTIKDYVKYLESYKNHFNLDKYIHYNSAVTKCHQDENENWVVEYNTTVLVCKKLIVCSGLNQTKKYPDSINKFTGEVIHTDDVYREMDRNDWRNKFTGKRVLLLGGAESAYDIGHVVVQYADQLYYATKNYTEWFPKGEEEPEIKDRIKKIDNKCLNNIYGGFVNNPTDTQLHYVEYALPEPISQFWHENGRKMLKMDCGKCSHQHTKLCNMTKTPDNLFKKYVVKRTEFMLDIYENKVELIQYPDKINGTTVYTKEETIENIDIIVCASGYKKEFPFLEDAVWKGELIKKMIPVKYKNIAFIGYARPTMGSIAAIAEMQGWWIEKYFNDASFTYAIHKPIFRTLDPLNLSNEHINTVVIGCYYLKDLAKDLRIEPTMWYLLLTDFELFFRIYSGSCHPMMYRIHGYKSYNGSRKLLLDTYIPNQERGVKEWMYFLFHNLLHLGFILFLFILGFVISYMVNNKKTRLYNSVLISSILVIIFYRFF